MIALQGSDTKKRTSPAVGTLLVLGIGFGLGVLLALTGRPGRPGPGGDFRMLETLDDIDVILSTMGLGLLVALLVVYAKTYADTHARSALGLLFVLTALLFEAVLRSPLLFGAFGHVLGGLGPFALVADSFRAVALAAFLYLSLQ